MNSTAALQNDKRLKGKSFVRLSSKLHFAKSLFYPTLSASIPDAALTRQFSSAFENALRNALEKLLAVISFRKYRAVYNEVKQKLALLVSLVSNSEKNTVDSTETITTQELLSRHNAEFFIPFQLACETKSIKILLVALDGLQKLLSCGFFSYLSYTKNSSDNSYCRKTSSNTKAIGENIVTALYCSSENKPSDRFLSASFPNIKTGKTIHFSKNTAHPDNLMSNVLDTILSVADFPEDSVQLQVLRCLLTAVTAVQFNSLHGVQLARAVLGVFALYGHTKSSQNQRTAQAAITQIINTLVHNVNNIDSHEIASSNIFLASDQDAIDPSVHKDKQSAVSNSNSGTDDALVLALNVSLHDLSDDVKPHLEISTDLSPVDADNRSQSNVDWNTLESLPVVDQSTIPALPLTLSLTQDRELVSNTSVVPLVVDPTASATNVATEETLHNLMETSQDYKESNMAQHLLSPPSLDVVEDSIILPNKAVSTDTSVISLYDSPIMQNISSLDGQSFDLSLDDTLKVALSNVVDPVSGLVPNGLRDRLLHSQCTRYPESTTSVPLEYPSYELRDKAMLLSSDSTSVHGLVVNRNSETALYPTSNCDSDHVSDPGADPISNPISDPILDSIADPSSQSVSSASQLVLNNLSDVPSCVDLNRYSKQFPITTSDSSLAFFLHRDSDRFLNALGNSASKDDFNLDANISSTPMTGGDAHMTSNIIHEVSLTDNQPSSEHTVDESRIVLQESLSSNTNICEGSDSLEIGCEVKKPDSVFTNESNTKITLNTMDHLEGSEKQSIVLYEAKEVLTYSQSIKMDTSNNSDESQPEGVSQFIPVTKSFDLSNDTVILEDALMIFSLLCSLTLEDDPVDVNIVEEHPVIRIKKISLELLLYILQNQYALIQKIPGVIDFIFCELYISLIHNCVSYIPNIFGLSLSLFSVVSVNLKENGSLLSAVFVENVLLCLLNSCNCSYEHKLQVLRVFYTLFSEARFVTELYINFDCRINEAHVLFNGVTSLCNLLTNNSTQLASTQEERIHIQKASAEILVMMFKKLCDWVKENRSKLQVRSVDTLDTKLEMQRKHQDETYCLHGEKINHNNHTFGCVDGCLTSSLPFKDSEHFFPHYGIKRSKIFFFKLLRNTTSLAINQERERKQHLQKLIQNFNKNPSQEFDAIIKNKYVEMYRVSYIYCVNEFFYIIQPNPESVARFFLRTPLLEKQAIGHYLGCNKPFNINVLHALTNQMNFKKLEIDVALRKFLSHFRLPGEAQKIDRMMETFAGKYVMDNPGKFANSDCAYILSFSLIMLHTDAHARSIKPENKMTVDMFIRNNRGINDNADLPSEYLEALYSRVVSEEWVVEDRQSSIVLSSVQEPTNLTHARSLHAVSSVDVQQPFLDGIAVALGFSTTARRKFDSFLKESKAIVVKATEEFENRLQPLITPEGYSENNNNCMTESGTQVDAQKCNELGTENHYDITSVTISSYIPANDNLVGQVEPLFQSVYTTLLSTIMAVLQCEFSTPIVGLMLELCDLCVLLAKEFRLVTEGGHFFSCLVSHVNLPLTGDKEKFNDAVLSETQIQCLQHLFHLLLTEKCHDLAEHSWKQILQCYSQVHEILEYKRAMSSKEVPQKLVLEGDYSFESENMNERFLKMEIIASTDASCVVKDDCTSDVFSTQPNTDNALNPHAFFSTESLKNVFGLSKPPRISVKNDDYESIHVHSEPSATPIVTKLEINCELIASSIDDAQLDALFLRSCSFSPSCVVEFIKELCNVSKEELHLKPPRTFSLQKLVEVTDYNMSRICLIWYDIWTHLVGYFVQITSGTAMDDDIHIGLYAVDSLRQLAIKFFERKEYSNNSFQTEFLKPFRLLMESPNVMGDIKVFLVAVLKQIIQIRAGNIHSGWKCIIAILQAAPICEPFNPSLCLEAFYVLKIIIENYFGIVVFNYLKELLKALSNFCINTLNIILPHTDPPISIPCQCIDYIEAIVVLISGENYSLYCSAMNLPVNDDILKMEKNIIESIPKDVHNPSSISFSSVLSDTSKSLPPSGLHLEESDLTSNEHKMKQYTLLVLKLHNLHQRHAMRYTATDQTIDNMAAPTSQTDESVDNDFQAMKDALLELQTHNGAYLFPLLTCLSHLATPTDQLCYAHHQRALLTLFRLLYHLADKFLNEDTWKMSITGILFPFLDDLQLHILHGYTTLTSKNKDRMLVTHESDITHQAYKTLPAAPDELKNGTPPPCSTLLLFTLCLNELLKLIDLRFAQTVKHLPEFLSLFQSYIRGSLPLSASTFTIQTLGKLIAQIALRCSHNEWDCIIITLEYCFRNTRSEDLRPPVSYNHHSILGDKSTIPVTYAQKSSLRGHTTDTDNTLQRNTATTLSSNPICIPQEVIRNCVLQLHLIELIDTCIRPHLACLDYIQIDRVLNLLHDASTFARNFNRQIDWRYHLKNCGLLNSHEHLPGLLKQERTALCVQFNLLFSYLTNLTPYFLNRDIHKAEERLIVLLENLTKDYITIYHLLERSKSTRHRHPTGKPYAEYSEKCQSEMQREVNLLTTMLSTVILDGLSSLSDAIFNRNAGRLFICLIKLTRCPSATLSHGVTSLLIDRITPLLDPHVDITTLTQAKASVKLLDTAQGTCDIPPSPPPPPEIV